MATKRKFTVPLNTCLNKKEDIKNLTLEEVSYCLNTLNELVEECERVIANNAENALKEEDRRHEAEKAKIKALQEKFAKK